MEHLPYPKIPTRTDGGAPAPGGIWVATEKVHGAQVVVATDGRSVRVGKRKAWLESHEAFFGWQLLRVTLEAAARAAFAEHPEAGMVRLYGELFGGAYPHAAVAAAPGTSPVQTGIWYAPDVHFVLFDVLLDAPEPMFLAHAEVEQLAATIGLPVVPLLGRGPRATLERLPVHFPTRVPALLGLPPLADNIAEGFVLKPDARATPAARYVVKHKIPELDEARASGATREARFDESAPWNPEAALSLAQLQDLAARLVNPARVASARSKVGTDPTAVAEEVLLDVLVDLEAAFPAAFRGLTPEGDEALRSFVLERAQRASRR